MMLLFYKGRGRINDKCAIVSSRKTKENLANNSILNTGVVRPLFHIGFELLNIVRGRELAPVLNYFLINAFQLTKSDIWRSVLCLAEFNIAHRVLHRANSPCVFLRFDIDVNDVFGRDT